MSLVTPSVASLKTIASFEPVFTYPIFGEEEQIFGYKNLKIGLRYNASDMRPNATISYTRKFPVLGEAEPDDVESKLKQFLPEGMIWHPRHVVSMRSLC